MLHSSSRLASSPDEGRPADELRPLGISSFFTQGTVLVIWMSGVKGMRPAHVMMETMKQQEGMTLWHQLVSGTWLDRTQA
jgi:hypothetical protein